MEGTSKAKFMLLRGSPSRNTTKCCKRRFVISGQEGSSSKKSQKTKTEKQATHRVLKAGYRGAQEPSPPCEPQGAGWCSQNPHPQQRLASPRSGRQLSLLHLSSAVLSSTSNILSDIQEYTHLQMKGISYAIDFCIGSALYEKRLSNSSGD